MPSLRSRLSASATVVGMVLAGLGFAALPVQVAAAQPFSVSTSLPANSAAALGAVYSAPSGAIYVATNGSDSNAGTLASPYQTLSKAMSAVKAGGTIVLRGGVYRQGASAASAYKLGGTYYFTNIPSGVTIQSYQGETVWFDGTQQVKQWTKVAADHYTVSWDTPDFCSQKYYTRNPVSQANDGPCSYPDSIGGDASLGDPQMVFRNGKQLTQVGSLAAMTSASTFYYDWSKKVMHIKFDPAGSTVEVTKFAQAMALYKPTNFSIKGIGFRRYATNQIHNATAGAVLLNLGSNVLIENSAFVENAASGLQGWQTANLTIRRSVLASNGGNGMNYDGNWQARGTGTTPADNLVIEYSRLDSNNLDRFGVNCTWSCGAAGAKLTGTAGMTLRYSSFSFNAGGRGTGFWCDLGCRDLTAYSNVFDSNDRHGLIYEISDKAIIASNLFVKNGWNSPAHGGGYAMYIGSARVRMYNNTLVDNRGGVGIYDDARSSGSNTGGYAAARIGADTVGTEFVNNIVTGGSADNGRQLAIGGGDLKYSGNTTATKAIARMSNNSYHKTATTPKYWFAWNESAGAKTEIFTTVASVQSSKGLEADSQLSTAAANPYLSNAAGGDYTARSGSPADGTAKALPSDIAALFAGNVNTGDRGVITLDGKAVSAAGAPAPAPAPTTATPTPTPTPTPTATPTTPATTTKVVSADFGVAVASGWGTASTGGAWTTSGTGFSVASGVGRLSLAASGTRSATLNSVSAKDVVGRVEVALDKVPAGGQTHFNLDMRKGTDGAYRVKVRFLSGGSVSVVLAKLVGTAETTLATRTLSGYTLPAGGKVGMAFQVHGQGASTVKAKVWGTGQPEPADWTLTANDSQATLQDAGALGVSSWVEASVTNGPIGLRLDNLVVNRIG